MELSQKTLIDIRLYVLNQYPKEACGVIIEGNFIPLTNVADNPEKSFKFDPITYAGIVDSVEAIIHSHCRSSEDRVKFDLRTPSLEDRIGQRRSNKLWGIVGTEGETVTDPIWYPHIPHNNYIGRSFIPYVDDCFTIVQDYIQFELGKTPPKYDIEYNWPTVKNFSGIFEKYLSPIGFVEIEKVSKLQNGDILIVNHELGEISHLVIYDNGELLHQAQKSCRIPFSYVEGNIVKMLRYVGEGQ